MHTAQYSGRRRLFTVEQANATLPLVRAIVSDVVRLSQEVIGRRERLAVLSGRPVARGLASYGEELSQIEDELEKDIGRLRQYAEELRELGAELKSAADGLVDFPAMLDDRMVWLCWKLGEPEVQYWHPWDAGFEQRERIRSETQVLS